MPRPSRDSSRRRLALRRMSEQDDLPSWWGRGLPEPPPPSRSRAAAATSLVSLAQLLAAVGVFAVFYAIGTNAAGGSDDPFAGFGFFMFAVFGAPLAALVAGPMTAKILRLPLPALYLLPVVVGTVLALVVFLTLLGIIATLLAAVAAPAVGDLLIGLATFDRMR